MKKKRRQRVVSILMALLMIVGLVPTDFDVTVAKAADPVYVHTMDISAMDSQLATYGVTDGGSKIFSGTTDSNILCGTDNYFTLMTIGDKLKLYNKTSTPDKFDSINYNYRVQLDGGLCPNGKAGIKFTTTSASTVTVYASGKNTTGVLACVSYDTAVTTAVSKPIADTGYALTKDTIASYTFELDKADTYVLGALTGGRIYYVSVDETPAAKATISNATVSLAGNVATVNWSAVNGAGLGKTTIECSTDGTSWTKLGTVAQNITTYTHDLSEYPSGTYQYRVTGNAEPVKATAATAINWTQVFSDWKDVSLLDSSATLAQSSADVTVNWNMILGSTGADSLQVELMKGTDVIGTQTFSKEIGKSTLTGVAKFTPKSSGIYSARLTATRAGQADKVVTTTSTVDYVLALTNPTITSLTSNGDGSVTLGWTAVDEASNYTVYSKVSTADDSTYVAVGAPVAGTITTTKVSGLTIDTTYTFKVVASRTTPAATTSATADKKVGSIQERTWDYSVYGGSSINSGTNTFSGSVYDNTLHLVTTLTAGKYVTGLTADQLGFYYTKLDAKLNFTLTAKVTVNSVTMDGGQDAFGLMASDTIGTNGDTTTFYNNAISTFAGKVGYYYNNETGDVSETDNGGALITMKNGIGARLKAGFVSTSDSTGGICSIKTLESSCGVLGVRGATTNIYNVLSNVTNAGATTQPTTYTDLTMTLKKDNTGYRCMFVNAAGETVKETFYDYKNEKLTQFDPSNIYVGFFTSRNADISISDVSLTTISREDDAPAEAAEITYVAPKYTVTSPTTSGVADYNLVFTANADGVLTVKDASGNVIVDAANVTAGTSFTAPTTTLNKGSNAFTVTFKPNDSYVPGEYMALSSYDEVSISHTVTYKTYGVPGQSIWVSPTGTSTASGNSSDPMDIFTAVKYVQPGQTIVIMGGTYNFTSGVTIARGIDGTADSPINMVADPAATTRPVFDFGGVGSGIVFGGDYWYISGFDVTNTADGQKGLQLSGSNCTLDQVNTYHNGNSGVSISRLLTSDLFQDWPANNLILNCTSYGNADSSYADADGFAAKLTIGEGNVFKGCIAHNNADDGWDLFAKVDTGKIGKVTIYNCVAYNNGILEDGTNAGNGNGFKLGGESITGYHELTNCISYDNKAKGIDSNSCPDIQITNCTTFNNGSYNVAFYTNTAKNTDFSANGIISFRTANLTMPEQIKLVGTQDSTKVYGPTNYYWDGISKSVNSLGAVVSSDWFTSLDTSIVPTRDADGSINMHGLLALTDKAPANAGARMVATPSQSIVIPASVPAPKTGDVTHIYLFITLSIMSGAALVGLYFYDKKRKKIVK